MQNTKRTLGRPLRNKMNNLKPWYTLDIDVGNAINPLFNKEDWLARSEFANSPIGIWHIPQPELSEIFTEEWLQYMKDLNLEPGSCLMFYREPYYLHPSVHIDMHGASGTPMIYALNWVIGNDDSEMVWYDVPKDSGNDMVTPADTPYVSWPINKFANVDCIKRKIGNHLTLVNVSKPHNIIVGSKPRWVMSIRFPYIKENIKSWESAVEYFKPFIKE